MKKMAPQSNAQRPTRLDPRYINGRVQLPYGLKVAEVEQAVAENHVGKLRSNFLYRIPGVGVGRHRSDLAGD